MPPAKVVARHVVECEVGLVNIDDLQEGFAALRPARQCMERSAEEARRRRGSNSSRYSRGVRVEVVVRVGSSSRR